MSRTKYAFLSILGFVSIWLMLGCAGYGKLRQEPRPDGTLGELRENWNDYTVYYFVWRHCGVSMLFDPKANDKNLNVADGWTLISDEYTFSRLMLSARQRRFAGLHKILGPDNEFYGYLLGRAECANVKVLDSGTLRVEGVYWIPGDALGP